MDDARWIQLVDRLRSADEAKRMHAALLLSRSLVDAERTRAVLEPLVHDAEPVRSLALWVLTRLPGSQTDENHNRAA